jgi:hypothetical protein
MSVGGDGHEELLIQLEILLLNHLVFNLNFLKKNIKAQKHFKIFI